MENTFLPWTARWALMSAAATPIPPKDPLARIRAIEKATEKIKAAHPQLFRK